MRQLSAPAYVVLGMVHLGARSGYEIKRAVENSIRFFWTISQAQIYPSLELLESAGLITGRADPQGRRPRRVFETTQAGEAALRDWLTRDEPMLFELRDTGLLKIFFADALDPAQALTLLQALRQRSEDRVEDPARHRTGRQGRGSRRQPLPRPDPAARNRLPSGD